MKNKFNSEAEMAKYLVDYLKQLNWTVYQEVKLKRSFDNRADIIAVQNNIYWVIETKLQLSFDLLEQAFHWKKYAHLVSIATPYKKYNHFIDNSLKHFGIGQFRVDKGFFDKITIEEILKPKINRSILNNIKSSCLEGHKDFANAGNANSHYFTEFKQTAIATQNYIKNNPGCSMNDIIKNITTHYKSPSTARLCLATWIRKGIIKNIKTVKNGKKSTFFWEEQNNDH